jgi:hypothetical protein
VQMATVQAIQAGQPSQQPQYIFVQSPNVPFTNQGFTGNQIITSDGIPQGQQVIFVQAPQKPKKPSVRHFYTAFSYILSYAHVHSITDCAYLQGEGVLYCRYPSHHHRTGMCSIRRCHYWSVCRVLLRWTWYLGWIICESFLLEVTNS